MRKIRSTNRLYRRAHWFTPLERRCWYSQVCPKNWTLTHTHACELSSTHVYSCAPHCKPVRLEMLSLPITMTPGFSSLLKTLERQKMSVDSMKRPLMMAALNGLYVARMPVPESPAEEVTKANTDERVRYSDYLYLCGVI